METTTDAIREIAAMALEGADVKRVDASSKPFVIVPEGYEVREVEDHLQAPVRKSGTVNVRDVASLLELVKLHRTEATRIYYVQAPTPRFLAVFNDASAAAAGWGDHTASYVPPLSPEWLAWTGKNRQVMAQADFAQFVEDNLPDILEPVSTEMLEVSRTLQAKKKAQFASGLRLSNGEVQFNYEEKVEGTAGGRGQFKIPEVFVIAVPVFEGGPAYRMNARFRYRISEGGMLSLHFDLERPHKIVEHAVGQIVSTIKTETGLVLINGMPAAS